MQTAIDLLSPDQLDVIISAYGSIVEWIGQTASIVSEDHIF